MDHNMLHVQNPEDYKAAIPPFSVGVGVIALTISAGLFWAWRRNVERRARQAAQAVIPIDIPMEDIPMEDIQGPQENDPPPPYLPPLNDAPPPYEENGDQI
ncbi:unnamed protein product [Caenorhabditis brenneri]